jgi:hypothetical protein
MPKIDISQENLSFLPSFLEYEFIKGAPTLATVLISSATRVDELIALLEGALQNLQLLKLPLILPKTVISPYIPDATAITAY